VIFVDISNQLTIFHKYVLFYIAFSESIIEVSFKQ
jgi:hypothetical protein